MNTSVFYGDMAASVIGACVSAAMGSATKLVLPNGLITRGGVPLMIGQSDRELSPKNVSGVHVRGPMTQQMLEYWGENAGLSGQLFFQTQPNAVATFDRLINEAGENLQVVTGPLQSFTRDPISGAITSLRCGGVDHAGLNFHEGTYEGDLGAMIGCLMRTGRDSTRAADEPTAGVRPYLTTTVRATNPLTGRRLPGVDPHSPHAVGNADNGIMAMANRVPITDHPDRLKWEDNPVELIEGEFDAQYAVAYSRRTQAAYQRIPGSFNDQLRPVLTYPTWDMNNGSLTLLGASWIGPFRFWPYLTWEQRFALRDEYQRWFARLMKTICTSPKWAAGLPEMVADTKRYGLVPGLWPDSVIPGMPAQVYVRLSRSIMGQEILTFASSQAPESNTRVRQPVCIYGYHLDAHHTFKRAMPNGNIGYEGGGINAGDTVLAQMPWGALKTRRIDAPNVTMSFCVSASMIGSIYDRVEFSICKNGEVSGVAMAIAGAKGIFTDDLSYDNELRPALNDYGMPIDIPGVAA